MTDPLDDLFSDTSSTGGSGQSAGGKLREQLEAVLAQNKQLQEQLAQTQANERDRAVSSLFEKHKIPDLARDFFPKDAQPNDEVATAFVEKYGQLWGATSASATTTPDQQAQTSALQQFQSQQTVTVTQEKSEEEYAAMFAEVNTRDELLQMLSQLGSQLPD